MKVRLLLVILFLMSFSSLANSENRNLETSVFSDYLNNSVSDGFINIPGLEFKSSMGVSFGSSGDQSMSMGYYMGHFNYGLGESWNLNLDVGVRSVMGQQVQSASPELFINNIDLSYRPSKGNFMLRLQFRQYRYPFGYGFR